MNRYLLGLVNLFIFFTASAQIPDYGIRGVRIGSNPSTARPDSLVLLGQNRDAASATYGLGKWQGFFLYADGDSLCVRVGGDTVCIDGAITNPGMANADSSIVIVDDYTELKALVTNANFAFVTDSLWGGYFYQDASGTPDSALIVDGAGSREWVRIVEENKYWLTWWINNDTTWEDEIQRAINVISDRHGEYGTGTLYIPYVDTPLVSDTYTYWLDTVGVDPFDTFDIKDVKYCVELKSNMAIIIDPRATLKLIDSLVVYGDSTNRVNIFIADSIQNVSITGGTIDGNASGQYQEVPGYYGVSRYGNIFHLYDTAEVWGNEYISFNNTTLQNHSGNGIYFENKAQKINLQDVQQYGLIDSATVQHIHYMHIMRADSNVMDGFHLIDSTEIITNVLDSAEGSWIFKKINPIQAGNDAIWVEFQTSNEYAGDDVQTNITMNRGFNLGPGGGALVAGIPAWGESIEFHYAFNSTDHFAEWHDLFVDSSGVQHRTESKIIDKGDFSTWSKYYTLNQLAILDPLNNNEFFRVIRNDSTGVFVDMFSSRVDEGFRLFAWPADDRIQLRSHNNAGVVTFDIFQDKPLASYVNVEYLNYEPTGSAALTIAGRDVNGFLTGATYPVLWDSLNNHIAGINGIYSAANNNTDAAVTEINVASGNDILWDFEGNTSTDRFVLSSALPLLEFDENDDGVDWIWYQEGGAFAIEPEGGNDSWRIGTNGGGNLFNINTSTRAVHLYGGTMTYDNAGFASAPVINFIKDDTHTAELRWLNGSYLQRWNIVGTAAADMDLRIGRYTGASSLADYPLTILNSNGVVRILNSGGAATTITGRDTDEGVTDVTIGDFLDLTTGTLSVDTTGFFALYGGGGTDTYANIKVDDVDVSTNAPTLDFTTPWLTSTESPTDEFQIALSQETLEDSINQMLIWGNFLTGSYTDGSPYGSITANWDGFIVDGSEDAETYTVGSGISTMSFETGTGLDLDVQTDGSVIYSPDFNEFTTDADATAEGDEFVILYDASAGHEKIDINDLPYLVDGEGTDWDLYVNDVFQANLGNTENLDINGSGGITVTYDNADGEHDINISGSGGSVTFGTDNQVPFVNAGGTDFDYDADFTFNGTDLAVGLTDLYVDGAGNMVGINDATPDHNLDIHQASDATDGLFIESTTTADEAATINLRGRQDGTDGISSSITFSNFDDDGGAADATANLAMIEIDRVRADDHGGIMTLSTFKINTTETEHIILDGEDESTQINRIMLDRTTQSTATLTVSGGGVYHTSNAGAVTVSMPDSDTYPGAVIFIYCPSATSVTFSASGGDTITDLSTNDNHPLTVISFSANSWVVKN